jgi:putative membrane-bound dehydrogenase-like protein
MPTTERLALICFVLLSLTNSLLPAQVPHGQDVPPGPALSPSEAMAKMQLPPGFKVELAAAEPDVVNPTAMTFDDRGRIWVCESFEYPRREPGPGRDRIRILEDTDGDGRYEKVTVFKEGLNIPCGIVHGNGGVYVTNAPDVLFLRDVDGDDRADTEEVLFTGFGRDDTHELPNNLVWGPDGWLYGMNGVFNAATVTSPGDGKTYSFTCAIWRYHPKTKVFELFSEGTSNPWGLDFNRQGDWFITCCVIDHLFHMTQSGYYLRQGGPYPPHTVHLPSIATEKHQKAAYAGLAIYDADAYPEEYCGRLLMGNLHGGCINQDVLTRNGSTYVQKAGPDFLSANDAWFMPVAQKIGPDGCIYIMDWYDRYHCYQDANRDSPGLDRAKGRIYRITYNDTPRSKPFDLGKMSRDELVKLLSHPNVWWRRQAQRVLNEKFDPSLVPTLQAMALDPSLPNNAHMHALWLLASQQALDESFHERVLGSGDAPTRNWGVRAAGQSGEVSPRVFEKLTALAADPSPDVRVQVAIAAGRLAKPDPMPVLLAMLGHEANARDPLIPNILYNNLKAFAPTRGRDILAFIDGNPVAQNAFADTTARWVRDAVNATGRRPEEIVSDLKKVLGGGARPGGDRVRQSLQSVINGLDAVGVRRGDRVELFDIDTRQQIRELTAEGSPARVQATTIALWWNDRAAVGAARQILADPKAEASVRGQMLRAMAERRDPADIDSFAALAGDNNVPIRIRQQAVDILASTGDAQAARSLTERYAAMHPELKPAVLNALTRSAASAAVLLDAVGANKVPVGEVNANHVRQIHSLGDAGLSKRIADVWGVVKTERDPERVKIVEQFRQVVQGGTGDAVAGTRVFDARCAQCHTIYGKGGQVGPDLTGVGRETLDAILTNVIDPNLVIGKPYYVHVARTKKGTVFSGLLIEETDKRIVLRDGTKTEIIQKEDLDRMVVQNISMMPEGLEKTMTEQEFRDLVAFLLTRESPAGK